MVLQITICSARHGFAAGTAAGDLETSRLVFGVGTLRVVLLLAMPENGLLGTGHFAVALCANPSPTLGVPALVAGWAVLRALRSLRDSFAQFFSLVGLRGVSLVGLLGVSLAGLLGTSLAGLLGAAIVRLLGCHLPE